MKEGTGGISTARPIIVIWKLSLSTLLLRVLRVSVSAGVMSVE
jgi:hypothetical protein